MLKALLTPSLVLFVSIAQRRWGHLLGGRLAALPLTSGPFVLLLAATDGPASAVTAIHGLLIGMPAVFVFYGCYCVLAARTRWWLCLPVSVIVTATVAAGLDMLAPGPVAALLLVALGFAAATLLISRLDSDAVIPRTPSWELPARILVSTGVVLGLGAITMLFGARIAGVLAAFPAVACVLVPFTHRASATGAVNLVRGFLSAAPWSVLFFASLLVLLPLAPLWLAAGFACAAVIIGGCLGVLPVRRYCGGDRQAT